MTAFDLGGLGALLAVSAEWLALGWLSGVGWPGGAPWGPAWALRLLVGAIVTGLSMLLLAVAGVSFGQAPVVLGLAAGLAYVTRRVAGANQTHSREPMTRQEQVGWMVLGLVLLAISLRALVAPEAGWDAYSHWGLKAKAAFLAGGIVDTNTAHEYYPPLVPLLETWLYIHRGVAQIDLGKAVWLPIGCAFAVCLAWHLRLVIRPAVWAAPLLGLGVLLGTTELLESFSTGQGDLALTACLCLATLAAFQAQREPSRAWLVQTGVFGLGAGLTKYEGLARLGVVIAALLLEAFLSRRARLAQSAGVLAGAALVGYLPWVVFRALHQIAVTSEHLSHLQPEASVAVLAALVIAFASLRTGGGLLVAGLGLGGSLLQRTLLQPPLRLLALVVLGQATATFLAFLVTDYSPVLQVQLSATRLVGQWLPLALFVVGVVAVASLRPATEPPGAHHPPPPPTG
jgi:hypothetical protein